MLLIPQYQALPALQRLRRSQRLLLQVLLQLLLHLLLMPLLLLLLAATG